MATVYKRRELRPIPEDAEIITYRGKPYAAWTDGKGKARRAPLNAGGNKIVQYAECYTCQYFDETGTRRKAPTGCHDKATAQQVADKIETEVALRRRGHIDPTAERYAEQARRPITEHVDEFQAVLQARENTPKHVDMTMQRVRFIVEEAGTERAKDLTASAVQEAIKGIRDAGRSLETCNSYLRAIKSFTRWMFRDKRTPDDPLQTLEAYNADTDPVHPRRELTQEELDYLLPFVEGHTLPAHRSTRPGSRDGLPGGDRYGIPGIGTAIPDGGQFRVGWGPAHGDRRGGLLETAAEGRATDPAGPGRSAAPLAGRATARRAALRTIAQEHGPDAPQGPRRGPQAVDFRGKDRGGTKIGERKASFCATRIRPDASRISTRLGIRTFLASWPAGHRSRRPKNWPGIPTRD